MNRHEREEKRQRIQQELDQYAKAHSPEEYRRHVNARYPSGRWSRGGANRSSNVKREIGLRITRIPQCVTCGGVTPEVASVTSLFAVCVCGPLISSL